MSSTPDLAALNAAYAVATAAFLQATIAGRDHYRVTLDATLAAEARWLADPDNELHEQAAAAAHTAMVTERAALVRSIAAAKAARTKRTDAAWDDAMKASSYAKK